MNVAAVLIEILRSAGVRYLFGNPGTTELPFTLDALLPDSGLEYMLGLQEATAADGYAQATGQVGVVNVHVAPGLASGPIERVMGGAVVRLTRLEAPRRCLIAQRRWQGREEAFMSPRLLEIIGEREDAMGRSAVQSLETGGGAMWHATAI